MEPFESSSPAAPRAGLRTRPDMWKLLAALALAIIAICAIISTVTLVKALAMPRWRGRTRR